MNSALATVSEEPIYSEQELSALNPLAVPKHIAIIMDGNRRWAKRQKLPAIAGHWRGAETLSRVVRAAGALGVEVLTVYAFSTENWKRPPIEVNALLRLFKAHLLRQTPIMQKEGVRLQVIGDVSRFPKDLQKTLRNSMEATKGGTKLDLVVALNYGGRDEIKRAVQEIAQDCMEKKVKPGEISEELIERYLDTAGRPDPDLLIRPSGENRVSNFLLWQISYSEVHVTKTLWPDFSERDLLDAILNYQTRELRLGK